MGFRIFKRPELVPRAFGAIGALLSGLAGNVDISGIGLAPRLSGGITYDDVTGIWTLPKGKAFRLRATFGVDSNSTTAGELFSAQWVDAANAIVGTQNVPCQFVVVGAATHTVALSAVMPDSVALVATPTGPQQVKLRTVAGNDAAVRLDAVAVEIEEA